METVKEDVSYDTQRENKEYKKTIYHCLNDDVWMIVEIPKDVI